MVNHTSTAQAIFQNYGIHIQACNYLWVEKDIGVINLKTKYWCLYYHDQITAAFEYDGKRIIAEPRWFYLIPPNTDSKGALLSSSKQLVHFFSIQHFMKNIQPGIYRLPAADIAIEAILTLTRMDDEERQNQRGQLYSYFVINYTLIELDKSLTRDIQQDSRIQSAIAYINTFYDQKIHVTELAAKQNMTREAFARLFKQETGETPYRLITRLRINKARLLLLNDNYSIRQIAEATGYIDPYHFSRLFKKWVGDSPSRYRKQALD